MQNAICDGFKSIYYRLWCTDFSSFASDFAFFITPPPLFSAGSQSSTTSTVSLKTSWMLNPVSTGGRCLTTGCTAACTSSPPLVTGRYCTLYKWSLAWINQLKIEAPHTHTSWFTHFALCSGVGWCWNFVHECYTTVVQWRHQNMWLRTDLNALTSEMERQKTCEHRWTYILPTPISKSIT